MEPLLPTFSTADQFESLYVRPKFGPTMIVGSRVYNDKEDRRKRYPNAVGFDMQEGEGVDVVRDLELPIEIDQVFQFDHVECLSVLEHSKQPWLLAANIQRMLKPGGTIYVTVPFVWAHHGYPSDYWRMTPEGIAQLFPAIEWVASGYASNELTLGRKIKRTHLGGHPYFPRTEAVAFGVRK